MKGECGLLGASVSTYGSLLSVQVSFSLLYIDVYDLHYSTCVIVVCGIDTRLGSVQYSYVPIDVMCSTRTFCM